MIYSVHITTSKDTSISSPKTTELFITKGLIYRVDIDFPSGSAGLMGVIIFDGSFQVWPSTLEQWFTGDDNLISFEDIYLKNSAPYIFKILTYNEDTIYSHSVNVRIGLVSKEIYMARFLPHLSYKFFEKMLKRLQTDQVKRVDEQKQAIIETPFPWL
ncbi:hypothetical protein LCGC14_0888590 [marine sediment metagenome]|uniref:Uncharacterized protein n=1 Tax=marine sediment metagenome TaxID=412755 RepID=A0A0F9RJ80_9ZZZZ